MPAPSIRIVSPNGNVGYTIGHDDEADPPTVTVKWKADASHSVLPLAPGSADPRKVRAQVICMAEGCNGPVPENRRWYCSEECNAAEKKRRYREENPAQEAKRTITRDEAIALVQQWADTHGFPTVARVNAEPPLLDGEEVSAQRLQRPFASWSGVLSAAGLTKPCAREGCNEPVKPGYVYHHEHCRPVKTVRRPPKREKAVTRPYKRFTQGEGINLIKTWAEERGEVPTLNSFDADPPQLDGVTFKSYRAIHLFGSWQEALRAAGLEPRSVGRPRVDA